MARRSVSDFDLDALARVKAAAHAGADRRGGHVGYADLEDMASEVLLRAVETGGLSTVADDLAAAQRLASAYQARERRSARAVDRALGLVGPRSDVGRLDVAAEDVPFLPDAKVCEVAGRLSSGVFDAADPVSVAKARAVVVGIAGAPVRVVRDRPEGARGPVTTAGPVEYAARLAAAPAVGPYRPGVLAALRVPVVGAPVASARAAFDLFRLRWEAARPGQASAHARAARTLGNGRELAAVAAGPDHSSGASCRLRARAVCSGVAEVLRLLDGAWQGLDLGEFGKLDVGKGSVADVSALLLVPGGSVEHVRVSVGARIAKGSQLPVQPEAFIRRRQSGHGSSDAEVHAVQGADRLLDRWETGSAIVLAAHRLSSSSPASAAPSPRRGRPRRDLLRDLDAIARRCGVLGIGDASGLRLRIGLDEGAGIGSLGAVDLLTFCTGDSWDSIDVLRNRKGSVQRAAGFNAAAVADLLAAGGVKCDPKTVTAAVKRWAGDVSSAAAAASTGRRRAGSTVRAAEVRLSSAAGARWAWMVHGVAVDGSGAPVVLDLPRPVLSRARVDLDGGPVLSARQRAAAAESSLRARLLSEARGPLLRYLGGPVPVRRTWADVGGSSAEYPALSWVPCDGLVVDLLRGVGARRLLCSMKGPHGHYVASGVARFPDLAYGLGSDRLGQAPAHTVRVPSSVFSIEWRAEYGHAADRVGRTVVPVRRGGAPASAAEVAEVAARRARLDLAGSVRAVRAAADWRARLAAVEGRAPAPFTRRHGAEVVPVPLPVLDLRAAVSVSVPVPVKLGPVVRSVPVLCRCGLCEGQARAAVDLLAAFGGSTS